MRNYRRYVLRRKRGFINNLSITNWLILINVIFYFLVIFISFANPNFLDYIALKPSDILHGKNLWTLLTHMFMHAPLFIFHLLFNMLTLFFIGNFVERIIGRKRYLSFYIISGIISGLFFVFLSLLVGSSYFWGTGLEWQPVGASGALFAVAGLMTLLTPNLPLYVMFIPIPIKAKYAVPGLLIVMALIAYSGRWPIGNAAHLGGFICGAVYGFYLRTKYKKKITILNRMFQ